VTPGYINDPERTAEAFDDQGYFKMGDAVSFANPDNPSQGLRFAGRIAEQFKLQSGTWVSAGSLRAQLVASCAPWVRDVVVCGVNEAFIGLLVWPNVAACSQLTEGDQKAVLASSEVIEAIRQGLSEHNAEHSGSTQRVERFLLLDEPPSVGDGEITEKGYVNQGLVQRRRNVWVRALYAPSDIAVWPV
jgi:feruloyl-CoA synthase